MKNKVSTLEQCIANVKDGQTILFGDWHGELSAEEVITGSLVNAKAIAEYIRRKNPEVVSLVCMGTNATSPADEDELCAAYIKSLLEDAPLNIAEEAAALRDGAGAKFFNPDTQEIFPEPDFWMCSKYDLFDFVIRVTPKEDYFETEKIKVL